MMGCYLLVVVPTLGLPIYLAPNINQSTNSIFSFQTLRVLRTYLPDFTVLQNGWRVFYRLAHHDCIVTMDAIGLSPTGVHLNP